MIWNNGGVDFSRTNKILARTTFFSRVTILFATVEVRINVDTEQTFRIENWQHKTTPS